MLLTIDRLRHYCQEMGSNPHVTAFLNEVERHANQEIIESAECLKSYGYAVTAPTWSVAQEKRG